MLDAAELPALPGALELAAAGVRTGGDRRNREFAGTHVESSRRRGRGGACVRPADGGRPARVGARRAGGGPRGDTDRGRPVGGEDRRGPSLDPGSFSASGRRRPTRAHGLGAHVPSDRGDVDLRPLPRHHVRRLRPAHRVGARLRELAALRRQALPGAGLPRLRRVRQPDGRARRHRAHARRRSRLAPDRGALGLGALGGAGGVSRRGRADPDGRDHDRARPSSARGDDALPPRARGLRSGADRGARGMEPARRPRRGGRAPLAPSSS